MIETDNYVYRFLTTSFVRTENMKAFKVVSSSQEDCGSTYRQFTSKDGQISARQFGYFPNEGSSMASFQATGQSRVFTMRWTLTLRDYPFDDAQPGETRDLALVQDLTDTHWVKLTPGKATITYLGREDVFGAVRNRGDASSAGDA